MTEPTRPMVMLASAISPEVESSGEMAQVGPAIRHGWLRPRGGSKAMRVTLAQSRWVAHTHSCFKEEVTGPEFPL